MSFNALSLAKLGVGFGALAVASIGLLAPAPVEAEITQVYGGKYRDEVSREIIEKQWELVELRKAHVEIERKPDNQGATTELLASNSAVDTSQATAPAVSIEYPFNLRAEVAPIETVKPAELVASQAEDKAKKAALLRKRQDEEALLMILLNL